MEKVLVAMSGGVDSAVCALLLKRAGYEPYGVTMQLLNGIKGVSPTEEYISAKSVAEQLGIPFEVVDYSKKFESDVVCPFVKSYIGGETPNPCVECNRKLKFGALLGKADELGIKYIATGHYAVITNENGVFRISKAKDTAKDQTYMLCGLTQAQLSRVIFPLGNMTKAEIRKTAEEANLINAKKSDSQDICFIHGEYSDFIKEHSGFFSSIGDFKDMSGKTIGRHNGYINYTIGQRRGLGMGFGERMYVVKTIPETDTVILGGDSDLFTDTVYLRDVNIISGEKPEVPFKADVKIRYRHKESPTTVYPSDNLYKVVFDTPVRAPAPGQWGAIYDGDCLLGGGIIKLQP